MGVIAEHWGRWECPFVYGIFFPDDTYVQMQGLKVVGDRLPISISDKDWVEIDPSPLCEEPFFLFGGESSWEGAGLLVVCDPTGQLRWMLHCEVSEPFTAASVEGKFVQAVSEEYPRRLTWRVPVHSPADFQVAVD